MKNNTAILARGIYGYQYGTFLLLCVVFVVSCDAYFLVGTTRLTTIQPTNTNFVRAASPSSSATRLGYCNSDNSNYNNNTPLNRSRTNNNGRYTSTSSSTKQQFMTSMDENDPQKKRNREITRQWETEILSSTKEKTDLNRVQQWLQEPSSSSSSSSSSTSKTKAMPDNGWQVALASGTVCGLGVEWLTGSPVLSLATVCGVFFVALRDPMEEDDNSLVGPITRIIGRSAIKSYVKTEPKLKAVARAAVQGEEAWMQLQAEVRELRTENAQLKLYVKRREWIDQEQSQYSLEELKILAQRYQITYSGATKAQLMMRLLQVGALRAVLPDRENEFRKNG